MAEGDGLFFWFGRDWEDRKEFSGENNKNKVPGTRVLMPSRSEIG